MFLKKKKVELGDQFAVFHEREAPRFAANCGIGIEGFEGEGLLKNISGSGCCMESVTYAAITPNQAYKVRVIPAPGIAIKPFSVMLTVSWTKSSEMVFEAGFTMKGNERNSQLEEFAQALQSQGVQPEYGNMGRGGQQG